jgi:hypothetical protein
MENEIKFDENTRKLIRAFRAKVCNGQHATRETLLAYAFLKDRPYIALERKINEDHESFGIGRDSFLSYLVYGIRREILQASKNLGFDKEVEEQIAKEIESEIRQWIMKKYEKESEISEEKAA